MTYRIILILIATSMFFTKGYAQQAKVLTLGVFHFEFPNLDAKQYSDDEQIDVRLPRYQKEIELIVSKIAQFKPEAVVVERPIYLQQKTDSLFHAYLSGNHKLSRNEVEQLGFRIAKACHSKIYCADAWGVQTYAIEKLLKDENSKEFIAFEESFINDPDSLLRPADESIFKQEGILAELIRMNNPEQIRKSLGNYLIGHFKYEAANGDYTGVDFETGRWFNRNLRIFRNIQRIPKASGKRILVIFGSGHMNLLNYFFECSPEYKLLNVNEYLK